MPEETTTIEVFKPDAPKIDDIITPRTRTEHFLGRIAGDPHAKILEPRTRRENFLAKIAGDPMSMEDIQPRTRREYFLNKIAEKDSDDPTPSAWRGKVNISNRTNVAQPIEYIGANGEYSTFSLMRNGTLTMMIPTVDNDGVEQAKYFFSCRGDLTLTAGTNTFIKHAADLTGAMVPVYVETVSTGKTATVWLDEATEATK